MERELEVLRAVARFAPPVLRLAAPVLRVPLLDLAAPVEEPVELRDEDPPAFFAAEDRDEAPLLLARDQVDERRLVLLVLRPPVLRLEPELERDEPALRLPPLLLVLAEPSIENLPDSTRCAA